jgi:hypothetical protein
LGSYSVRYPVVSGPHRIQEISRSSECSFARFPEPAGKL